MAAASGNSKRLRDGDESAEFPETKRFRQPSLIFDILDDDDDVAPGADMDSAVDNLADVIKILEDEITAPAVTREVDGPPQLDIGYLLEASDDELGIPPAAGSSPCSLTDSGDVVEISDEEPDVAGFDRIWGFEDDVLAGPYGGLYFGMTAGVFDGINVDGYLFDYSDAIGGISDAGEYPWPTDSLTAV